MQSVLVASPQYLAQAGQPEQSEDLLQHALLLAQPLAPWALRHSSTGARYHLPMDSPAKLRVNDAQLAVGMAIAGVGIVLSPLFQASAALAAGQLVQVLPQWQGETRTVYAVWPQRSYMPARVAALVQHLVEFAACEPLLGGLLA
jgi:LysR family transcriptional regulator, transcriptional activator AphB